MPDHAVFVRNYFMTIITLANKWQHLHTVAHRRRPGAEFGEDTEKNSLSEISEWRFLGKNFHFHVQNFWWPVLVIHHVFRIFPVFFLIFHIFTACNVVCDPSSREKPLFQKIIPWWHLFLLCSCFCAHPANTTSQNIRGTDAWAVPHLKFGGPSPSPPICLRPCSS